MIAKLKRLVARWLARDLASELRLEKLDALQSELSELRNACRDDIVLNGRLLSLETDLKALDGLLQGSGAEALAAAHKQMVAKMASFAETAILSEEGAIENTHGDRSKISAGQHSYIRGRLLTYGHGGRISIGDWVYVGVRTEIWSMNSISIGNRVLISHDVNIHDGTAHSLDAGERHQHFKNIILHGHPRKHEELPGVMSAPIKIEDDVWISFGVSILRGVTIGARSVIAAGSLVTKDVPPDVLYQCDVKPTIKALPVGYTQERPAELFDRHE